MKNRWTILLTVLLTLGLPFAAVSASHEHDHGAMDHSKMEGMKHEEIARVLGCRVGTCKSQLHKARMRMRELLAPVLNEVEASS